MSSIPGGTWTVDPGFSSVTFSVRHMEMRDYRAGFRARLLSAEFLAAATYPDVRFVASELEDDESRDVTVAGELTIHGQTRPVQARGRIGVPGPHLLTGSEQVTVELAATIDRREFGLEWQEELPDGGLTLSNAVLIEAVLEFVLDG